MAKIVFAWELGNDYGHIAGFLPLAKQLRQQGHEVIMILRNLAHVERLLETAKIDYWQAPVWWPTSAERAFAISYPDILLRCGYHDEMVLRGLIQGWRRLLQHLQPDLLLADHSPTAVLAGNIEGIPRALFGPGFFSPPRLFPMPSLIPWKEIPLEHLIQREQRVLGNVNAVLRHCQTAEYQQLSQMFEVEENFLCTLPELDHYDTRPEADYWGPRLGNAGGVSPRWPSSATPKIFAYLKTHFQGLEAFLAAMAHSGASCLIHCPGIAADLVEKFTSTHMAFSAELVNMRQIGEQADLVICHGGHGTVAAALLAGLPVLMLPLQLEQMILTQRLSQNKLAHGVNTRSPKLDYTQVLRQALEDPHVRERARQFAEHYAGFSQGEQLEEIGLRCEELITARRGRE